MSARTMCDLSPAELTAMLSPPAGAVKAVLDTDTYNEIDDQFALALALRTPSIRLEAIYAAPFWNDRSSGPADGMERSFQEIRTLLALAGSKEGAVETPAYRGSTGYLEAPDAPRRSDAALDLVERAMRDEAKDSPPLYVMAIAAPTNVASAILLEPRIARRIVVVWLGGQPTYWPSASEFNLRQDAHASRVLLDSGVPLVLVPCKNVAEHLRVTGPELDHYLGNRGSLAEYLRISTIRYMAERGVLSKPIWDIAVPSWLRDPSLVPTHLEPSPILNEDLRWSFDAGRHPVRIAHEVRRDEIFRDLYEKLRPSLECPEDGARAVGGATTGEKEK